MMTFTRLNWLLLGLALVVLGLGYLLLSIPPATGFWSLSVAPVLLVLGYCVLVPAALLAGCRNRAPQT